MIAKMRKKQARGKRNDGELAVLVLSDSELIPIKGSSTCRVINFREP